MRLVKISAPVGLGERIAETAFAAGVESVEMRGAVAHARGGETRPIDIVDLATSTPTAKRFIDTLLAADYYDNATISINVRQPRSIISDQDLAKLTVPLEEPATDLFEELWQFSHVTYGLAGRLFIAGCLLGYGLIEEKVLFIVAGLLFIPVLPMAMAISYGIGAARWKLAGQGALAVAASTLSLYAGGLLVALISGPPMRFSDNPSIVSGILVSLGVGAAAALAAMDDAGRRELIGLAAASQLAIIPVWFGVVSVFGLPADHTNHDIVVRCLSFAANLAVLILTILFVQYISGVIAHRDQKPALRR
jgi:hypothetical protein